jgi:hypothetical protein
VAICRSYRRGLCAARRLGASCRRFLLCSWEAGGELPQLPVLPLVHPECWGQDAGAASSAARRLGASCRRCLLRFRNVGDELPAKLAGCRGGWGWAAAFLYIWLFWWVFGNLPNVLYSGTEGVYLLLWTFEYFVYLLWYWCVSCCHFGICLYILCKFCVFWCIYSLIRDFFWLLLLSPLANFNFTPGKNVSASDTHCYPRQIG